MPKLFKNQHLTVERLIGQCPVCGNLDGFTLYPFMTESSSSTAECKICHTTWDSLYTLLNSEENKIIRIALTKHPYEIRLLSPDVNEMPWGLPFMIRKALMGALTARYDLKLVDSQGASGECVEGFVDTAGKEYPAAFIQDDVKGFTLRPHSSMDYRVLSDVLDLYFQMLRCLFIDRLPRVERLQPLALSQKTYRPAEFLWCSSGSPEARNLLIEMLTSALIRVGGTEFPTEVWMKVAEMNGRPFDHYPYLSLTHEEIAAVFSPKSLPSVA